MLNLKKIVSTLTIAGLILTGVSTQASAAGLLDGVKSSVQKQVTTAKTTATSTTVKAVSAVVPPKAKKEIDAFAAYLKKEKYKVALTSSGLKFTNASGFEGEVGVKGLGIYLELDVPVKGAGNLAPAINVVNYFTGKKTADSKLTLATLKKKNAKIAIPNGHIEIEKDEVEFYVVKTLF